MTDQEIKKIDHRIKSALVELPDSEDADYYVKIWFNYKHQTQDKISTNGRQEFISKSKDEILQEIENFMQSQKNGWTVV